MNPTTAVHIFLVVLGCACIFGLLYWFTTFIIRKAPSTAEWMWVVQIVLVFLIVMVAIGIICDVMGYPLITQRM